MDIGASNPAEREATIDQPFLEVLGPVNARDRSGPLGLGGPKQKTVLAMLITARGDVVTAGHIAQAVYGDDAPPRARRRVQTYVSTLRGILGEIIVRRGSGWVLDLDPDRIDAVQFETMVAAARTLDPLDASAALHDALDLWRGPPYADIESHGRLDGEIARLEELRLVAVEARLDADLAAGRAGELIAELSSLIAANPYREHLRAQHMLALYRAGRQREALRSYEELREVLLDALGVNPTPELRDLERRILDQDEGLLVVPESTGRPLRGYRLIEEIGSGAFSIVWRGVQPSVGRDVAVKQIRGELATRPEFIRRFEAEAQYVARLEHPHIVPLIDFWRDPDSAYLVMRWLRGGTVEQSLDDGAWSLDRTLRMAAQIGDALYEAHRRGVVHRDVKTANILLDERGNAFLGDFGIALGALDSAGPEAALSSGSPAYASPEQLRHEPLGPGADIFSFGVVLYECLAGRLPFPEVRSVAEMVEHQLHTPYPSLREVRPEVPAHVADAIAKATAKPPEERFASVLDLVDALHAPESTSTGAPARAATRQTAITGPIDNPYKGLRAFDEGDAAVFFGRERLVDELVAQLGDTGVASRCVSVVGPSGSGKSSVVRAGLVPAVRAGRVAGSEDWFVTTMLPGERPFESLEAALLRIAVNPPASLLHQLQDGDRGVLRGVRRCLADDGQRVLLVIDQLEELFTAASAEKADAFLAALAVAVDDPTTPLRVVATLRADYYGRPLAHGDFAAVLKAGAVDVTPLAPDELETAITGPVQRLGVELEPGLVTRIAAEAAGLTAPLPLLQYCLAELFDRRDGARMTSEAYEAVGGLAGSLGHRAEEIHDQLSPDQQAAVRRVFGRLVSADQSTADLRRRALVSDVGSDDATRAVLDRFGAARLLTFDRDVATREPTVEVAHEALFREWPRLVEWLDDDRELIQSIDRIATAADTWAQGNYADTDLYRGGRLETATDLTVRAPERLRPLDRDFVAASRAAADAERELEAQRVTRLRRLVVGVGIALIVALVAAGFAFAQQRRADDAAEQAEANELRAVAGERAAQVSEEEARGAAAEADEQRLAAEASAEDARAAAEDAERERALADARALTASASDVLDDDLELALLLALAGVEAQPQDPTALRVLRRAMQSPRRLFSTPVVEATTMIDLDLSPDGRRLVTTGIEGVAAYDVESGEQLWRYDHGLGTPQGSTWALFVSGGTEVLVAVRWEPIPVGDTNGPAPEGAGLHLLDAQTGELKRRIAGSPCGAILADDVRLAGNGVVVRQAVSPPSPDESCLLDSVGQIDTETLLLDLDSGTTTPIGEIEPFGQAVPGGRMAFDESGTVQAFFGAGGVLTVTDLETGEPLLEPGGPPDWAFIRLSPDGSLVATGGSDQGGAREIVIFEVAGDGEPTAILAGHNGATSAARFTRDNQQLISTGDDGRVNVWNVATGELLQSIGAGSGSNRGLALSADETRVAVIGAGVNVVSLDPTDAAEVGTIEVCESGGDNFYLTFGLDVVGSLVHAVAACDAPFGQSYVIDRTTGQLVGRSVPQRSQGVGISDDGRFVAAQSFEFAPEEDSLGVYGSIVVTDVVTGEDQVLPGGCEHRDRGDEPACQPAPEFPQAIAALDLDFSPDGDLVANGSPSEPPNGIIWSRSRDVVVAQWRFLYAEFLPQGDRIVTFGDPIPGGGWRIAVRDTTEFEIVDEIVWPGTPIWDMLITPDGSTLIVIDDTDLLFYGLDPLELQATWPEAHASQIRAVSVSPDGSMLATAATDGSARVWDLQTGEVLHDIPVSTTDRAQGIAFSGDGTELLVSTAAGPIWVYSLDPATVIELARDRVPRGFTSGECERYFVDRPCPSLDELTG